MVPLGIMKSERIKMASRTKLHTMIIWPRCEKLCRGRCVRKVRIENELFNEKKERVMFTTREIAGHGWCVFDAKTGIMVRENLTWGEVMEFAVRMNLPCREYDRENEEVILY